MEQGTDGIVGTQLDLFSFLGNLEQSLVHNVHFFLDSTVQFFLDSKLVVLVIGLLNQFFATIENFQWFSEAPSPLNGMVRGNHWKRLFFNGFGSANHW